MGLLALLSLLVLLLIYVIRPNYQQQYISSTYIWKLSLKYRRKKIPTSRIRNILIIICQVLILAACALIIAEPAVAIKEEVSEPEVAIILDSSASMRTDNGKGSRMERAVSLATDYALGMLEEGGYVSVIRAAGDTELLISRASGVESETAVRRVLNEVLDDGCTYGTSDLNAAIDLCQTEILSINPDAEIRIYTDMSYDDEYLESVGIDVVNMADADNEWNAAVTYAYTEKIDGYYVLYADIMSYGMPVTVEVDVTFKNATYRADSGKIDSETTSDVTIQTEVQCDGENSSTLMILNDKTYDNVFADVLDLNSGRYKVLASSEYAYYYYDEIEIRVASYYDESDQKIKFTDSYDLDNVYYVYGGRLPEIEVLYVTTETHTGTTTAISAVRTAYADTYAINVTSYTSMTRQKLDDDEDKIYTTGYDLYIYEHVAPTNLPTDGVVFLFDPDIVPEGAGFSMMEIGYEDTAANHECYLSATDEAEEYGLMRYIDATKICLTKASVIYDYEAAGYVPLMTFESTDGVCPALLLKDSGDTKVVIMTFSVEYSNIAVRPEYTQLFMNFISYFFPTTITGTDFTVGDVASVTSFGPELTVWFALYGEERENVIFDISEEEDGVFVYYGDDGEIVVYSLPIDYEFTEPGRYRLRVTTYFVDSSSNIRDVIVFVHADSSESDIFAVGTVLTVPYREKLVSDYYDDLLLWFAIVLVAIIFIEWILHMLEGM
ncbi:MAG: VWA domain-containing protein [Bacteroidales bacterium]|nr:VWA domain-containing protein [Bacteroidales bacterium]